MDEKAARRLEDLKTAMDAVQRLVDGYPDDPKTPARRARVAEYRDSIDRIMSTGRERPLPDRIGAVVVVGAVEGG
jgi:antitoxin component HigA of HigAB toxin-antitoxin module